MEVPGVLEQQHGKLFPVGQLGDDGGDVVTRRVHRAGDVNHLSGPLAAQVVEEGAETFRHERILEVVSAGSAVRARAGLKPAAPLQVIVPRGGRD